MIITRLAPSPTGPLHIGTARTALFNFLHAKKYRGQFRLRIEDTDKSRCDPRYIKDIQEGLKWLRLEWDGEIVFQSRRLKKYQAIAQELVAKGTAYQKEGAIWFKIPSRPSHLQFKDAVKGKVTFKLQHLKDFVILRRDGIPTFHLASVVDDAEMGVTDVIRGEDHLSNTPLHILIQKALGYKTPRYAHLPLILNPDRTKMSKRTAPTSITADFRAKGYLPEAMINFLALLGWNPKTNQEFFTLEELIEKFNLSGIQRANAIFDLNRLNWFNRHYLRQLPDHQIVEFVKTRKKAPINYLAYVQTFKDRAQTLFDFLTLGEFIFSLPEYPAKLLIFKKSTKLKTQKGLEAVRAKLATLPRSRWQPENLQQELHAVVSQEKLSNGDVFWPVRVALSGLEKSPSPGELLAILGPQESLRRLEVALEKLQ